MDWDLKMPTWDFAELERADNCSVDLKLGGLGYIRQFDCWKNSTQPMVATATAAMVSSSSSGGGSMKRPRPPSNGCHIASCSVDGCLSDLSKGREYHRRHKVCEVHSKTAIVVVGGKEQRFCQQCSRFHLLLEFDEVKRSCRKRLDGHNRRRRKPQQDPFVSGSFTGNRFTSYHQVFATPTSKSNWPMLIKNEDDFPLYTHRSPRHAISELQHFPLSSSGSYKEVKQLPFLQQIPTSQPLPTATPVAASSNNKMFDSDCALSLLSSSAALISDVNLSQVVHPHYYPNGFSDGNGVDFNSHGLFHVGLEGSSDGNSHTLPFDWQ